MKKLGKKFSFITKVMLVISLLFSNLAPLKIVFAYEKSETVVITKTTDNKLNIRYVEEVSDEYLDLVVDETYTYLDGTNLTATNSYEDVLVTDLVSETGIVVESILDEVVFDGTYSAVVKVERKSTDVNELVAVNEYVEEQSFEVGMTSKVYHEGAEVEPVNGIYTVSDGDIINSQLMSGGFAPTWKYQYNETVYTGVELLEYVFMDEVIIGNHLAGEHAYVNDITISSDNFTEDKVYNISLSLMYGSYAHNDEMLNNSVVANGYKDVINFAGGSKTGTLYIYPDLNNGSRVITAYDLLQVLESATVNSEMTFVVSDGTQELQDKYLEYANSQVELTVTPEEFYQEYVVDEDYFVTVSCGDLTITYDVMYFADVNGDKVVTVDDVVSLINKVLGLEVADLKKDDINNDKSLNLKDAVYLFEMINSKMLDVTMGVENGSVNARIEVVQDDINSGDTFTINYIVTVSEYTMNGIAGIFNYDADALELVSVSSNNTWVGSNNEESFLYLGDEYLELGEPAISDDTVLDEEEVTDDAEIMEPEVSYPQVDYVVVTATFKAKKAGEHTVEVNNNSFISGVNTLRNESETVTTVVVVNASSDNSLSSLIIGGQVIELVEDVLDYNVTVSNDVEAVKVEAVANNVAGKITSIVAPEVLAEGENTITITVEAENGDVRIYTVTVTREAALEEEEEETVEINYNTNNRDDNNNKEEEPVVVPDEEEEEEEPVLENDDDNKLSRIIIIILILLVIAGLIYLIFKDDDDDDTKKANKEIEKLKNDDVQIDKEKSSSTKSKNSSKKSNK